jgi:two-component system, cell cycle sensor histidine kinase and response regulator CckA
MKANDLSTHLVDPARLAALRDVALLDTPTEESFDRLTWLAAHFLKAPVALVSLVDADRQFFKSCIGLPEPWNSKRETPLSHSFCQHNRTSGRPLLIEDARTHSLFKDNLATRDLNVIAYLGIPLVTRDGYVLGSFCVIDSKPRHWTEKDVEVIRNLALAVMTEIQLRTEIAARHKSEEERDNLSEQNTSLHVEISARMQAEAALRKSEEELRKSEGHLRTLVQTIPDLIWLKDKDGGYLLCNSIFERLFDTREEDIIGKTDYSLFDREHADLFIENDRRALATGKPTTNEEWVTFTDDGHRLLLETIRTPMHDETGMFLGVLGIGRDITERKRTEEELRTTLQMADDIVRYIPFGMLIYQYVEPNKLYLKSGNPEAEKITGVGIADLIGREYAESWPGAEESGLTKAYLDVMRTGNMYETDELYYKDDRLEGYFHICAFRLPNSLLAISFENISERKRAEERLRESEEKFRTVANYIHDWEYWRASDGSLVYVSPSCERITGYSAEEFLKEPELLTTIIHPDDHQNFRQHVRDLVTSAAKGDYQTVCFRILTQNGEERVIEHICKEVFDREGKSLGRRVSNRDVTERKWAEMELFESERLYRSLFENMMNGFAYCQMLFENGKPTDFIYLAVNDAFEKHTGLKDVVGRKVTEVVPGIRDKDPGLFEIYGRVAMTREPTRFEMFVEALQMWFSVSAYSPSYEHFVAIFDVITERKRAEEELRKSEARFRTLVQTIPDLIWLKDKEGVYLACNKIFERLFGAREEDIIGKTDYDFVDRELADLFRAYDKKAIAAGKPSSNEEGVTFSDDGRRVLLETIKTPMYDDRGTLIGVLGIGRDITERKRNEEALQNYAFLMKEMGRAAKIGGWEFDAATGKGTWTEEVAQIHEVDPKEPTNVETGISFYTDESKEKITQAIKNAVESGKPYSLELELITAKGNHKWVKTIGQPFVENNKVIKVRGSFQDITERKQADTEREKLQMQLTQAQKMESVGRLAGGVAHDFNNMLGVILGYSELALEQTEENQSLQSSLKEIQMAAQRSADLTRQLLAFARKQTVVPKVLDLNTVVEGMLSMLRRLIGEDIDLVWLPGKKPGLIKIDPSQIDQILANLCVNARDAISDNGKVTVETDNVDIGENYQSLHADFQPGKYVLLAVSDNGCGMNEKTQSKLFEPFFTTKELGKGTGLGLASVYGIVKQNNGYINVYSELGLGTTFKIYLPRHETEEEQLRGGNPVESAVRGNENILLVEDEPAILKMTARMLEQLGYKVLKTNIPAEAIDLAHAHAGQIQLLMTDVVMPGMNGRALAKSILPINPGLRCLFMSGYTSNVIAHHGVLDEGVLFIQKPFNKQDLAAKIKEALYQDPD